MLEHRFLPSAPVGTLVPSGVVVDVLPLLPDGAVGCIPALLDRGVGSWLEVPL